MTASVTYSSIAIEWICVS